MASHQEVKRVFLKARELVGEERAAVLERECKRDGELRREVEGMLAAEEQAPEFLERPAIPPSSIVGELERALPSATERVSKLLRQSNTNERYVRCGELAQGGMGTIFEVFDTDLRRSIAMKVVRGDYQARPSGETPGIDSSLLARFLEEAQITGQLEHPGVVPVYELGIDEKGQVYFTMRRVKGRDLGSVFAKSHAGAPEWNTTRIVGILQRVCETMAFAHEKGIVHRDLKPANIMIGDFGEVYVMDWGLARARGHEDHRDLRLRGAGASPPSAIVTDRRSAGDEESGSPLFTMDGTVIGTPHYMPPEQANGRVEELDARADVYAVGAMLYHLIAGRMPYAETGETPRAHEVLARVKTGAPASLQRIARESPHELVAICEQAMQRDPARRYTGMRGLAADLSAYLEGRVVQAHRTGTWVELSKWVQRNRGLAGASALALVALVVGFFVSRSQYVEARERRADAESALLETRWQNYLANVGAAGTSLHVGDYAEAARRLAQCPEEYRGWEWRHFALQCDLSLRRVPTQTNRVTSLALAGDGSRLVSASWGGSVKVWDPSTWENVAEFQCPKQVITVAYAHGGPTIAVGAGQSVQLIDTEGRAPRVVLMDERSPIKHRVYEVAFAPDDAWLVSGSWDKLVRVWDVSTGEVRARLRGHSGEVHAVDVHPDGRRIASGSGDATVRVWDARETRCLRVLTADGPVTSVRFHPAGEHLLAGIEGGDICVWDLATGELARLEGHTDDVTSLAFALDGTRLISGSRDRTLRTWDLDRLEPLTVLRGHKDHVSAVAADPEGRWVLSGDGADALRVWDLETRAASIAIQAHAPSRSGWTHRGGLDLAFTPDGKRLVTRSSDGWSVKVWDAENGRVVRSFSIYADCMAVTDSLLVTGREWVRPGIEVWDLETGRNLARHEQKAHCLALGADSRSVIALSFGKDRDCAVDLETFALHPSADIARGCGWGLAAFPDGSGLLQGGQQWDGILYARDLETGALEALSGHEDTILEIAFHPDGVRCVTASMDNTLRIWDTQAGRCLAVLRGHEDDVFSVAISPDGSRIVSGSGDRTVGLWDFERGELLAMLRGHAGGVSAVAFHPDGRRIASADDLGVVRLWQTELADARRTWSTERLDRRVVPLVEALLEEGRNQRAIEAQVRADVSLSEAEISHALLLSSPPVSLDAGLDGSASWTIAIRPDLPRVSYLSALHLMDELAAREALTDSNLHTLGVIQLRLGRYQEALTTFARAFALIPERKRAGTAPDYWVWEAMCHYHLGDSERARELLDASAAARPQLRKIASFFHEAEQLLEGKAHSAGK